MSMKQTHTGAQSKAGFAAITIGDAANDRKAQRIVEVAMMTESMLATVADAVNAAGCPKSLVPDLLAAALGGMVGCIVSGADQDAGASYILNGATPEELGKRMADAVQMNLALRCNELPEQKAEADTLAREALERAARGTAAGRA